MGRRENPEHGFEDFRGFSHSAGTDLAAAEPAICGADDVDAIGAELGDISLDGRGIPHVGVHGGSDKDGAAGDEEGGAEEVVGESEGDAGDAACSGGGDDSNLGTAGETDVFALPVFVGGELLVVDGPCGERFEGGGADELGSGFGENYGNESTALDEAAAEFGGFIGRDTSADAEEYFAVGEGVSHSGRVMGECGLEVVEGWSLVAEEFVDEGGIVFDGADVFGGVEEDFVLHDFSDDDFYEIFGLDIDELGGAAVELHHALLDERGESEPAADLTDNVVFAEFVKHFEPSLRL
jgi:hypothetical protein